MFVPVQKRILDTETAIKDSLSPHPSVTSAAHRCTDESVVHLVSPENASTGKASAAETRLCETGTWPLERYVDPEIWVMQGPGAGSSPDGPSRSVVNERVLESFATTGVVKLQGVFSPEDAEVMREVVWRDLYHTDGVLREDRTTWHRSTPLRKLARAKRDPSFRAILGEPLRQLADALLGEGWAPTAGLGQLLVSFPDTERWHLPGRDGFWHSDLGDRANVEDPLPSVRIFAVFGDVPPRGGGTLLVTGSDRMIMRYVKSHRGVERSLKADVAWNKAIPWLAELTLAEVPTERDHERDEDRRRRFMDVVTDVDGVPAQVIEACGRPGDVYVCAPWTIHCKPPNASDSPRFLRAVSLHRRAATLG